MEEFFHFNVIIATLLTNSKMIQLSVKDCFDYIFVDECASASEPEALVPIAGEVL